MTHPMMKAGFEIIEHTADVGVTAWGPDPAEAFAEAARGMFTIMLGREPEQWSGSGRPEAVDLEVTGEDWPGLLVNWLSELLFRFEVDGFVPRRISVQHCTPARCAAHLEGVCMDSPQDAVGIGIKAVTYHQLAVNVTPERTDIRVIFDI